MKFSVTKTEMIIKIEAQDSPSTVAWFFDELDSITALPSPGEYEIDFMKV